MSAPKRGIIDLQDALGRYVVMTPEQRLLVALWIVQTYFAPVLDQTPYIIVTSPERRCGKSRLLELLALLVKNPLGPMTLPSEAVVFRNAYMNTLLLDEVDAIFAPKTAKYHEGLRAILNSGHRRGNRVPRMADFGQSTEWFEVYGPKVIAAIGTLPDTITDRGIPIRLQRKLRSESISRFRAREVVRVCEPIAARLDAWATPERWQAVADARPTMPDELNDRIQDGCEGLLALADMLRCGDEARAALVALCTDEREDSTENAQLKLLADIKTIFEERGASAIMTSHLTNMLVADGWADWYGRGINATDIANLLRPYGISSRSVREGDATGKGYRHDDFVSAWSRYLPDDEAADGDGE
jgi:Protein of unknown function (DUF3631)